MMSFLFVSPTNTVNSYAGFKLYSIQVLKIT